MTIQFISPRHRAAVLIALAFAASVAFAVSNLAPAFLAITPGVELSDHGHPLNKMDRKKIAMLAPTVMVLPHFDWSNRIDDANASSTTIVPVLAIKDASMVSRICDVAPNMMAVVRQVLRQSVLTGGGLSPDALGVAGHEAAQKINERLGKVWLKDMYLLDNVTTPVLVAAEGCALIR